MADLDDKCRCKGLADSELTRCNGIMTQEDLLCDICRKLCKPVKERLQRENKDK
jgi:hypothetical protein